MEEKVLARSEAYKNIKKICVLIFVVIFVGMMVAPVISAQIWIESAVSHREDYYNSNFTEYFGPSYYWEAWHECQSEALNILLPGLACSLGAGVLFALLTYFLFGKTEVVVTDKRVFGKIAFGKSIDLPIDLISATGTTWPKGLIVSTSSGKIKFLMIKNRNEIISEISGLLINRQNKLTSENLIKQEISPSNADELKKYKDLLDDGIISQEEFDAKKKQLLDL